MTTPPTNLDAVTVGPNRIDVSWMDVTTTVDLERTRRPVGDTGDTWADLVLITGITTQLYSDTAVDATAWQYRYRARGVDPDPVVSEVPWTPDDLAGKLAWWDAADRETIHPAPDGLVRNWEDKSGNGRWMDQTTDADQPSHGTRTINGKATLDFAAGGDHLVGDTVPLLFADATNPFEVYLVAVADAQGAVISQNITNVGTGQQFNCYHDGTNFGIGLRGAHTAIHAVPLGTPALGSIVWDGTTAFGSFGTDVPKTLAVGTAVQETGALVKLAARSNTAIGNEWNWLDGAIAEVVIVQGPLSQDDRDRMQGYLAHKWGLAGQLSTSHPYKGSAPTVTGVAVVAGADLAIDGARWTGYGACQYVVYPESGWPWAGSPMELFYNNRVGIARTMAALGLNVVRLSVYSHVYQGTDSAHTQAQWRTILGDLCDAFTAEGIHVVIADHYGTGTGASWEPSTKTLQSFRDMHLPMATDLIADARIGQNRKVLFEPMNEPGPYNGGGAYQFTEADLIEHYKLISDHYRAKRYRRPLIVDPENWAWSLPGSFASALTSYDPQIVFANHRYPRADTVGPTVVNGKADGYYETDRARHNSAALDRGSLYPILVTELGQNIDDTNLDPNPPRQLWFAEAAEALAGDIAAGRVDGVTVWKWLWDDGTTDLQGDNRLAGVYHTAADATMLGAHYANLADQYLFRRNAPPFPAPPAGTLVSFDFQSRSFRPAAVAAGISVSNIVKRGPGLLWSRLVDADYASRPALQLSAGNIDAATAISSNSYMELTITPDSGKSFTPGTLSFKAARGGASTPRGVVVRTSADGYATTIAGGDIGTARPTWSSFSADLSALGARTTPLTIRFYPYSPEVGRTVDLDDIVLGGSVA